MSARVSAYLRAMLYESNVELSSTAAHLAEVLGHYASTDAATAWPSMATLARRMRKSIRTVERARGELVDAGVIAFDERRGYARDSESTNRYRFPVGMPLALSTDPTPMTGLSEETPDTHVADTRHGCRVQDPMKSDVVTSRDGSGARVTIGNGFFDDDEDLAVPDAVLDRYPSLGYLTGTGQ